MVLHERQLGPPPEQIPTSRYERAMNVGKEVVIGSAILFVGASQDGGNPVAGYVMEGGLFASGGALLGMGVAKVIHSLRHREVPHETIEEDWAA